MILKTSLHIHTSEDKRDGHMICYDVYRLIDEAKNRGFRVLGFTPHQKFVFKEEFADYARKKGILLIPGIERNIGHRFLGGHIVILNCDRSAEKVKNFKQLRAYKKEHPEVFVISPHPTHSRMFSIGSRNLRKYIELFDAVEHSWLYSIKKNSNRKAVAIAEENRKPVLATADVHVLSKLDTDYALIEAEDFTADAVFSAIRQGRFENVTYPKSFLALVFYFISLYSRYIVKYIEKKLLGLMPRELAAVELNNKD